MEQCKLYSLSTCSHCKACKRFLGECGIEYEFTDVDLLPDETRAEVIDEIKKLTAKCASSHDHYWRESHRGVQRG